ncbi:ABC-three component system middle component 6 [Enterovibrio norvegicus]|uniref:ABC-three component system middle component 6 n=1 Tax=Enterovibrio norvegicus TaxID=188144 RepID=UPI00352F8BF0
MIMPNKIVIPSDSLIYISKFILENVSSDPIDFDNLYENVNDVYPKTLSMERFVLCLNFLFIIGRIEESNDFIKAKF